ncbi:related to vegetatible incompatibility protein HET-E-1 [Phialocephala subalpina]|uniref:Related to vegetatible incompatibility protein HET-E-1 n=1 Tax=Phialocephala subalpina TaxID=576137 RepID=A0A1L7XWW5_9HELO|nr:related to vegetatible incompatibility protein HET-E-1 [Phialocephala subalpina]
MANPQNVIADAFKKLKRSISEDDAHNFASTELNDIWSAVKDIDSKQRKRRSAQNLRRVEPLLRGIEKYTKVIEVLCNGTPYMPYVWAPIKLMLEIASHHRDVFEALLSAYADIGAALPRFDRYQAAFNDNLEFQHALAAVYSGILDFHQRAYKFFRRRAWHVIFLSLWKDFGSRFDSIIQSLKKQRDFLDIEAASFDIVEAKDSRMKLQDEIRRSQRREQETVEESERNARTNQLQHSITWLSADEKIQETVYERTSRRRHDKTCEWILNEPRWKNWIKDDSRNPSLWLDGKPGSGKSVMCSFIVQTLTTTLDLTTCYYFCSSQDTENICHQILAIIVLQIIRQHPEVCTLIANEYVYRGSTCGMVQLRSLVPQLLEVVGYTRIIVDGIDECSKDDQKTILKELQSICVSPTTHCKILFSSRREVHIREKLSSQPQVSLDGRQEVDFDIRSFIKYKVTKLRTSDKDLLDRVESILVEKADGMFLWVRLVVDELKHCYSDAAMETTATSLPKGLKAAYGRILDRIMDSNNSRNARFLAIRILGWMACSYRTLKIYELLDGLAFDSSNTTLSAKTKVRRDILDLCRPLIEDGPSSTVDFVHFSAKEYLLEEEFHGERPFIWRENAHLDIAFSCTAVLNSCFILLPTLSTDSERAAIIVRGFHGLLVYADKFWHKHIQEYCGVLIRQQRQFSPELLSQLCLLLRFTKSGGQALQTSTRESEDDKTEEARLEVLRCVPDVQMLLSNVIRFRAIVEKEDTSESSPEKISLDQCNLDPTHFSTVRYHYHKISESLLDNATSNTFSGINQKELESFQATYSASAFVCRYTHCVFNADGFETAARRAKHESQHQRRFRCAHSSCFAFETGLASRSQLNKHNERYHPAIVKGPSLAESLGTQSPSKPPPARYSDLPTLREVQAMRMQSSGVSDVAKSTASLSAQAQHYQQFIMAQKMAMQQQANAQAQARNSSQGQPNQMNLQQAHYAPDDHGLFGLRFDGVGAPSRPPSRTSRSESPLGKIIDLSAEHAAAHPSMSTNYDYEMQRVLAAYTAEAGIVPQETGITGMDQVYFGPSTRQQNEYEQNTRRRQPSFPHEQRHNNAQWHAK